MPEFLREEFILYATVSKGRDDPNPARRLEGLFSMWYEDWSEHIFHPFRIINMLHKDSLREDLEEAKLGLYTKRTEMWKILAARDVTDWTLERLIHTPKIGPKTARFIAGYLWDDRVAILDRHVLKFLRALGHHPRIVFNKGRERWEETYRRTEAEFLKIADKMGVHPLDLEDAIWRSGRPEMITIHGQKLMALKSRRW